MSKCIISYKKKHGIILLNFFKKIYCLFEFPKATKEQEQNSFEIFLEF